MAQKTYLFEELYMKTIIRNPKKVGLFGYRYGISDNGGHYSIVIMSNP